MLDWYKVQTWYRFQLPIPDPSCPMKFQALLQWASSESPILLHEYHQLQSLKPVQNLALQTAKKIKLQNKNESIVQKYKQITVMPWTNNYHAEDLNQLFIYFLQICTNIILRVLNLTAPITNQRRPKQDPEYSRICQTDLSSR